MRESRAKISLAVTLAGLVLSPAATGATPLYVVDATDGFTTIATSYSDVSECVDTMTRARLRALFQPRNAAFDPDTSAFGLNVLARGVVVKFDAAKSSTAITMTIPSIGLTRTFTGKTRDESARAVLDWFKKEGLTGALGKKFAELSAVDPLAGNPNSAQARTVHAAFDRGFNRIASLGDTSAAGPGAGATANANTAYVGASYRRSPGDYRVGAYTLPLGYSFRFNDDPRHAISVELPITYQTVEGGSVYTLSAGLAYSHPITSQWVLTAGADYGVAASPNLGSAGHLLTGTLTSIVTLPVTRWFLVHVGNMAGHSQTLRLSVQDYASDPGVKEFITKNGLMLYFSTARLARSTGVELFAMDTRFLGTRLYDSGYTEVGASFGISRVSLQGGKRYDSVLRIGVTGIFARSGDALMLNTGYLF